MSPSNQVSSKRLRGDYWKTNPSHTSCSALSILERNVYAALIMKICRIKQPHHSSQGHCLANTDSYNELTVNSDVCHTLAWQNFLLLSTCSFRLKHPYYSPPVGLVKYFLHVHPCLSHKYSPRENEMKINRIIQMASHWNARQVDSAGIHIGHLP